jgi:hypothetical protein
VVTTDWRRRIVIPVPFDPDAKWGEKDQHHVAGTVNGCGVRPSSNGSTTGTDSR